MIPEPIGISLPLGATSQSNEFLDWNYAIADETKVYQRKLVVSVVWPNLPNDAREKEDFLHDTKLLGNKYDESANNVISKWLDCADKQLGAKWLNSRSVPGND